MKGRAPRPFTYLLPQGNIFVTAPTGNITDRGRFLFRILVDNNQTIARLSDTITIDYIARHHNNYLKGWLFSTGMLE